MVAGSTLANTWDYNNRLTQSNREWETNRLMQTQMLPNDFGGLALQSQLFGIPAKSLCGRL
jgi:hypothetical protein